MKGSDYGNNKLYFQMWIAELQARLLQHKEYLHITVNGVNPGYVATGIWNSIDQSKEPIFGRILQFLVRYLAITPQQGSVAITHAATNPELSPGPKGRGGGKYINRVWDAQPMPHCADAMARSRLWVKLDEELHLQDKGLLAILGL